MKPIGVPLNDEGNRLDLLVERLEDLLDKSIKPKFIYVIPTAVYALIMYITGFIFMYILKNSR